MAVKQSVTFSDSTVSFATKAASFSDDNDGIEMREKGSGDRKQQKPSNEKRKIWLWIGLAIAVVAIAGTVIGVLFARNMIGGSSSTATVGANAQSDINSSTSSSSSSADAPAPTTNAGTQVSTEDDDSQQAPQKCSDPKDLPKEFQGTAMDQSTWLTMDGFNCSFTSETVGGLPLLGLNSTWSDDSRANQNVPALNKPWGAYGPSRPIRGVNIGGWLSLEPFITPSLFDYPKSLNIIDEWTLTKHLGASEAAKVLEKHYATFITEEDFKNIAAAGLDHVRIPFSYWAVQTYDDDPYVPQISWRYLLRALEWCRKYGLRVKLDLHALPGSQNGWNHSGHSINVFNWILGTDSQPGPKQNLNRKRSLDIHDKLSKFFAQPRYKNIIAFYGLANEPALKVPTADLVSWTTDAFNLVTKNGISAPIVFSESMKGLPAWGGQLQGHGDKLVLDVHEYLIFDEYLIGLTHKEKINYACGLLADDVAGSSFGPTMVGEWSQADTDCTLHLNGVFNGARWNGTFFGNSPACPTKDDKCDCSRDMADPSTYTKEYKLFLQTWAEAQMSAFERSWGYFYWTWKTESAPLWSYEAAWKGGFMPKLAYQKSWKCGDAVPNFGSLPEFF
ncbi:glycoside hydrolase superfamily [Microdochium trichocladiopsis]|uniref:glucan 1,3-beta-glucosidase n=1 Tax=Microdochium trichocladiopsis TaxID=1682393 RepID=A0A9P8XRM9_9PEZI|nr:glycoside hydrolase superfamily [Microdochium trichocladiopsis]KAH7014154.1 glycoside hydrolase superfamily [Microdochium trichocladiopsis]